VPAKKQCPFFKFDYNAKSIYGMRVCKARQLKYSFSGFDRQNYPDLFSIETSVNDSEMFLN
jgi:hypothetical protein